MCYVICNVICLLLLMFSVSQRRLWWAIKICSILFYSILVYSIGWESKTRHLILNEQSQLLARCCGVRETTRFKMCCFSKIINFGVVTEMPCHHTTLSFFRDGCINPPCEVATSTSLLLISSRSLMKVRIKFWPFECLRDWNEMFWLEFVV